MGDETRADLNKAAETEKPAEGLDVSAEVAAEASPVVPALSAEVLVESVEKFVKLPIRSVKDRSNTETPQASQRLATRVPLMSFITAPDMIEG